MSLLCSLVYVLLSDFDQTTYIGSTSNIAQRLRDHNAGKTKSVKHKLPLSLIYYEAFSSKKLARKREIQLKKNSAAKERLFGRIFE